MPTLVNQRHELFSEHIASGKGIGEAYRDAGYRGHQSGATKLLKNSKIQVRIGELKQKTVERMLEKTAITRAWVLDCLRENVERALQHRPVRDASGKEIGEYIYNGAVANRALELIGKSIGMFVERKAMAHLNDFAALSDAELVQMLAQEAQMLLLSAQNGDNDGAGGFTG